MAEPDNKKLRVPPNSKESEMMVLGCMLTSVNALNIGADSLDPADFYYTEHQAIYAVLKTAYKADKPADIHLIGEELKRLDKLEIIGGISYLTLLAQYAGTSAFIEEYVRLVRDKALLRRMIDAAQHLEKAALEDPPDVGSVLDEAQSQLFNLSQSTQKSSAVTIRELLTGLKAESGLPYLKELQERQQLFQEQGSEATTITGIPTHLIDLDKKLNGFLPSNLIILGARPSMGKTALAINIAENICFKNNIPVGIFSLEMSASQLLHRMICSQSEVGSHKIVSGSLSGSDYQRIVESVHSMQKHTMIIDDQPGLKITDLRARARRMKEAYNVGFIVIDYLQLISGSGTNRSSESRQIEISEISRMLKTLARELNIPILCLAQLSRKVEERVGHRPMMSDLRESGCLTGDAQIQDAETGELYTIKQLAERTEQTPIQVFAIDQNLKLGPHTLSKAFFSGKKKVYELKTRSGRSIKASANHPFFKLEGWTRLDQLKPGQHIAIPRSTSTDLTIHYGNTENDFTNTATLLKTKPQMLAHSGVYWDEIASITDLGEEDTYDATVPEVHNFVANDIIVHNSLEQDADVVMFLFRQEYYEKGTKEGIAEIIVSKNRHGEVGDVNLAFLKEIAKFSNYTPMNAPAPAGKGNKEAFSAFSV